MSPRAAKLLSQQVRDAIDAADVPRYRICEKIGIGENTMSRFMTGKGGLSMKHLDSLGRYLRLELIRRGTQEGR